MELETPALGYIMRKDSIDMDEVTDIH